jgi:WD40 repeat protein
MGLAFHPDGQHLASVTFPGGGVCIWDLAEAKEIKTLMAQGGSGHAVAFHPDGKRLVSLGGIDATAKLWDVETGQELLSLRGHQAFVTCLSFNRDGTRLATGGWDKTIKIWEAPQTKPANNSKSPEDNPDFSTPDLD